jgi:hypothetical protein
MAEFVQKKVEDMRPVLEQMKKLELFNEHEIRYAYKLYFTYFVFILIIKLR